MAQFKTVARVGDIPDGEGIAYEVEGRMVAVFNESGQYHAIDDFCPHMGASLAGGHVEQGVVSCPWHAWRFSICDGTWCDNPTIKIDHFEVQVVDDQIQVKVAPKEKRPPRAASPEAASPEVEEQAEAKPGPSERDVPPADDVERTEPE